jgi:hypothetical protein
LILPINSSTLRYSSDSGRLMNQARANFGLIRGWLQYCRTSHRPSCAAAFNTRSHNLKFIDCLSRHIVKAKAGERYLALSYVWGSAHSASPRVQNVDKDEPLPASVLPQVVEDAITVARNLGLRYLWVDKFCIDQENATEVHILMSSMHEIYHGAYATIVAVAGMDASCGLPGVSSPRKIAQAQTKWQGKIVVSSFPHVSHQVRDSVWATHGWTYQEAIFSRRCLFFYRVPGLPSL